MGAPRGNKNAAGKRGGKSRVKEITTFNSRASKASKAMSGSKLKPGTKAWTRSYFRHMQSTRGKAEMRARDNDPRYNSR